MTLLSRRGLFAGAAGTLALPRRRRPVGMKPDQEGVFFQVIVIGPGNQGVFIYDSAGRLIDSMAGVAGADPLTRSNQPGITNQFMAGPSSFSSVGLNNGSVIFGHATSATGPFNTQAVLSEATNGLGISAGSGEMLIIGPSGDTSGVTDGGTIGSALLSGFAVLLLPGTYFTNSLLTVAGTELAGCGFATIIEPGTGYVGGLLAVGSKGAIRNLAVQGGGGDAITVAGGVAEWWLQDLYFASNTGWCINATITGPTHGKIRGIRGAGGGAANGGGISLNGGTGGSVTAEVNLYDIDIQNCQATEVLFCSAVTDVRCDGPLNGSVASGVAANCITIQGACQSIDLGSIDIGGGSGTDGVLAIKAAGGNSPTEIQAGPGVVQSSGVAVGVLVSDSSARIWLDRIMSKRNHFDGFAWTGTGAFNRMSGCGGNLNNQAAGTAYDVNVTSSAHILNDGFSYVSGSTVAGRNISIVGNHYTEANPPSSLTSAGQAPAGW